MISGDDADDRRGIGPAAIATRRRLGRWSLVARCCYFISAGLPRTLRQPEAPRHDESISRALLLVYGARGLPTTSERSLMLKNLIITEETP